MDASHSHLTNIHPLVAAVLHRVEISRGRAGPPERGAHGELCCPVAIFSAADLSLQTEFEITVRSPKNNVWSTPALNYLQRKSCVESVEIKSTRSGCYYLTLMSRYAKLKCEGY